MKLIITGLCNSGKTTIFNALTRQAIETTPYPTMSGEPHPGVVRVPDDRIDALTEIYHPKKKTYATVEYVDYLGLTKGDVAQNRKVFDLIKDADAVVQVVRAFDDAAVMHPFQDVNALRDVEAVELELVFGDLDLVEKRLMRMQEGAKKGKKQSEAEEDLLLKCKETLDTGAPLRQALFTAEELRAMRHLQFASTRPEVVLINASEADLRSGKAVEIQGAVESYFSQRQGLITTRVVTLCGKIEMEIAQLSDDDAKAFLDDLNIREPALNRLINVSYDLLGLISFFTVGEDEVKAWTITKGTHAHAAAGKVHTDIERGFIRAEVVSYSDFTASGGMGAARERGLVRLEGKTYEVRDGDIINFRFNV